MARKTARLHRLLAAIEDRQSLLILTHDNPDPDAIGAAFGLRHLLRAVTSKRVEMAYSGFMGRAENRAMVESLAIDIAWIGDLDLSQFDGFILVDVQPQNSNHGLPPEAKPLAVIDHHPMAKRMPDVPFRMIRTLCGSTSTIIAELIQEAGVAIDERVATALLYGIKSDTRDLGRVSRQRDIKTYLWLFPQANLAHMCAIEHARLPKVYFEDLRDALATAVVQGDAVITRVGETHSRDIIPEMADLFLRLEGMNWSVCYGTFNQEVVISLRSADRNKRCDKAVRSIVKDLGSGGGHATMAAGRIPVSALNSSNVDADLLRRIKTALHVLRRKEKPLVNGRANVTLTKRMLDGAVTAGPERNQ